MQKINLDFIKKNHSNIIINNNNNNNNNNEKKNNKLLKEIKYYKKRIKEYNNKLINDLINNGMDNSQDSNKINNLNNKHIELYKMYLENLIKYFKFIDAEIFNQKELENYNNTKNYNDISNNLSINDTNILLEYKTDNNVSIKKFCNTNKLYEEPKILPKKKMIVKYNGKEDKKKEEIL